jgi:outer membrane protein assembly factor BamE (lipoprotein component of BamABCDE complex)
MWARTIVAILLVAFIITGCASGKFELQSSQRRGYRAQNIKNRHPEWDALTVQKVASRRVEIGMTREMVLEALGKPGKISKQGNEEKWGYEIIIDRYTHIERELVYAVYFENGHVVRTAGDRSKLPHAIYKK